MSEINFCIDFTKFVKQPKFAVKFGSYDSQVIVNWFHENSENIESLTTQRKQINLLGDRRLDDDNVRKFIHERCFLYNEQYNSTFYSDWHPLLKHSDVKKEINKIPFRVRKILLRELSPKESIRFHHDPCLFRVHIPIETSEDSAIYWCCADNQKRYTKEVFDAGNFYIIDTFSEHVALNNSEVKRTHMIADVDPLDTERAAAVWLLGQFEENREQLLNLLYERSLYISKESNNTMKPLDIEKVKGFLNGC